MALFLLPDHWIVSSLIHVWLVEGRPHPRLNWSWVNQLCLLIKLALTSMTVVLLHNNTCGFKDAPNQDLPKDCGLVCIKNDCMEGELTKVSTIVSSATCYPFSFKGVLSTDPINGWFHKFMWWIWVPGRAHATRIQTAVCQTMCGKFPWRNTLMCAMGYRPTWMNGILVWFIATWLEVKLTMTTNKGYLLQGGRTAIPCLGIYGHDVDCVAMLLPKLELRGEHTE